MNAGCKNPRIDPPHSSPNVGVVPAPHWDDSLYTSIRSDMDFTMEEIPVLSRPMSRADALEDLKEVEQRLEANDFLDWKGDKAQKLLDQFHRASEVATSPTQEKILEQMNEFSKKSNMLPSCLWIHDGVTKLGSHALDETGAYATVWRGRIGNDPQIVALKIIKRHVEGELEKELIQETLVWRQLDHKNIVPFIGAYLFNEEPKEFCLVSPWMENGNLPHFIKNNPNISPGLQYNLGSPTHPQALDIASGLAYLHGKGITHGDIKGEVAPYPLFDQPRTTF
ncbi:Rho guanine nucleotide exchange factor [Marasmius crinis-equi]|uniref:Rho guanine nucleotide exchange factor n=1 Tax=Marasmius crinis-equi TaxID=585013 RepID=A0ABR3F5F8_9AGAR